MKQQSLDLGNGRACHWHVGGLTLYALRRRGAGCRSSAGRTGRARQSGAEVHVGHGVIDARTVHCASMNHCQEIRIHDLQDEGTPASGLASGKRCKADSSRQPRQLERVLMCKQGQSKLAVIASTGKWRPACLETMLWHGHLLALSSWHGHGSAFQKHRHSHEQQAKDSGPHEAADAGAPIR